RGGVHSLPAGQFEACRALGLSPITAYSETSFAWVNSHGKEHAAYGELNFHGLKAHERWSPVGTPRGWFHQIGNIRISTCDLVQAKLEAEVERQHRYGAEARLLSRRELVELEPRIQTDGVLGAAYFPQEGWVDTFTLCSSLLHLSMAAGARFLPYHRVVELTDSGVRVVASDGSEQTFTADTIILAAGNGTRSILAADGIDFPTLPISTELSESGDAVEHPTVGLTCTTTPVAADTVRHLVHADDIALRPSAGGGLTLTDHPTASQWDAADPDLWQVPQLLLDRARRICPVLESASIETVALGNRILPADGVTIADWVDSDRRVYAVATHSGVTLCAHLAEVVSSEVVDDLRDPTLAVFGLDRFAAGVR
ncbi:MAG TPA: FAD-dependent oxidoreductase, partial [Mycobacterium sp.]